jgi:hypothetical protein
LDGWFDPHFQDACLIDFHSKGHAKGNLPFCLKEGLLINEIHVNSQNIFLQVLIKK